MPTRKSTYQNIKRSCYQSFLGHIESVPVHISEIIDDIDDVHRAHNHLIISIIGHHAQFKTIFWRENNNPIWTVTYENPKIKDTCGEPDIFGIGNA